MGPFPKKPRSPECPAFGATTLPGRHVGLVAVITVMGVLLMVASLVVQAESYWLPVGRRG